MEYEWDTNKNATNILKHGISFDEALEVFNDPFRITYVDDRFDYGEKRVVTIGEIALLPDETIFTVYVAYTKRNGQTRIITARKAKKKERIKYEQRKILSHHD